jgi:hypothetical protein
MTGRAGRRQFPAILLLAAVLLGGCVAPAVNAGAFQENAKAALSSSVSEARTAALAVQARLDAKVTQPYVNVVVTDSETALGPIQDSFGNVDPPSPQDDALRDTVMAMLADTSDALATARIAVRRQDTAQMRDSVVELAALADRMEKTKDGLG